VKPSFFNISLIIVKDFLLIYLIRRGKMRENNGVSQKLEVCNADEIFG